MRTIYFDETRPRNRAVFRTGDAVCVAYDEVMPTLSDDDENDDSVPEERRHEIDEQTYQALFVFGVVDAIIQLGHSGMIGPFDEGHLLMSGQRFKMMGRSHPAAYVGIIGAYEEGVLLHASLPQVIEILRSPPLLPAQTTLDVVCETQMKPDICEYRMILSVDSLRATCAALASFLQEAYTLGYSVQLWL